MPDVNASQEQEHRVAEAEGHRAALSVDYAVRFLLKEAGMGLGVEIVLVVASYGGGTLRQHQHVLFGRMQAFQSLTEDCDPTIPA